MKTQTITKRQISRITDPAILLQIAEDLSQPWAIIQAALTQWYRVRGVYNPLYNPKP